MDHPITPRVRRWTLILGATTLLQGAWALLGPRSFYNDFPVPGAEWVATLGPFNDHLARDFGSALAGLGIIALLAAVSRSTAAVRATMIGFIVFGVPHLIFHLTTFGEFSVTSASTQIAGLALFVVLPATLLAAMRHTEPASGLTA
jgi:hypothetical protein